MGVCSPSMHSKLTVTYIYHYHLVLFYSSSHSFSCASKIPAQSLKFSLVRSLRLLPFLLSGASELPGYTKWGSRQSLPLPMGKKTRWPSTLIVGVFWALRSGQSGHPWLIGSRAHQLAGEPLMQTRWGFEYHHDIAITTGLYDILRL